MAYLSVKLDHVGVLREARKGRLPDPSQAVVLAELGGVDGIVVHLRRDRRHIRERDVYILREMVRTRLTLEIAPDAENVSRALDVKPYMVTLVPEADREITTEAGLIPGEETEALGAEVKRLQEAGIKVSVHIEPDVDVVKWAAKMKVDAVRLHTGTYAGARTEVEGFAEIEQLEQAAKAAAKNDLIVIAGQGLDYQNILPLVKLGLIDEFVVGHAVVARAMLVGMERAVREMVELVRRHDASTGS
jgi:pyridoxine 5-phosphate synthase